MRHAQHGTKEQKKMSGHGLDRSGSDDWVEQDKVKIARHLCIAKTPGFTRGE